MTMLYQDYEEETGGGASRRVLWRILTHMRPHWPLVVGFLVTIALSSFLDSYHTYLSKRIVDEGIIGRNLPLLNRIALLYGSLQVVQALNVVTFIICAGLVGDRLRYDLRDKMFRHLQTLSFDYFNRTPVGWILARVTSDSERISDLVTWRFNNKLDRMPSGKILRLETLVPAVVHWSMDGWRTIRECRTDDTGLGIHTADFKKEDLKSGQKIVFTFYWPDSRNWERNDFAITVA